MRIFVDTDLLSMFAKVDAVEVLVTYVGSDHVAMTPGIREEISVPLQYGYSFPESVLRQITTIPLTEKAWHEYEQLWSVGASLGRGELEAIAFCRAEVRTLLERIKAADNLVVPPEVEAEIFHETELTSDD